MKHKKKRRTKEEKRKKKKEMNLYIVVHILPILLTSKRMRD